jgi:signal transduction histidine kinase
MVKSVNKGNTMKKASALLCLLMLWGAACFGQIENIRTLQKQLPLIRDSLRYVDVLNRLALLFYEDNVDSTLYFTEQARNISDRLQYAKGKADAANNLGIVYDMKGNAQLALRYYNEAHNRYRELHDSANVVQAIMNIALVYQEVGKNDKAVNTFKTAISMGRKLKRDSIMSLVWYNYLLTYPENFSKDSIPAYIDIAARIASKYKDKRALLAIEQLTADNYIKNNQRNKGVDLLQEAAFEALKSNLYYLSLDIIVDLGDLYAPTDSAMAVSYYNQVLSIAELKQYSVYRELISKKLYGFYVAKKDTAKAFFYSQKLLNLHDEQEKMDNASGVDYIEFALKDQQLESARVQSRYELWFLVLALVVCILTIIVLLVLWRNWKQLRKTTAALRLQFEQSESTMEALEVMNKNYARLIKIVAHDLRNPISAINSISSMLQSDDEFTDETTEMVNLIQVSSKNSLNLINELLETDFDQQQNLKMEEISADTLLQQCVSLLSFRAKDKGQQLILGSNVPVRIWGDQEKLWRVINNLVVNAIKFSPPGALIHVESRKLENNVVISVKDAGVGIPINIQSKIFDPFTSARRKGTDGEQPFGLGLYISKQIVEAHKGSIWFESEPGVGTTFYVELPVEGDKSVKAKA